MTIALLVVLAVVALWVIGAYNGLIALKNQVANAWKQIDVQLKRRHDLIPNLVNAVKGQMDFEKSTLEAVISARARAVGASGVAATARAEGELTQALGKLFALAENYPDLKSSANVLQLQEEPTFATGGDGLVRRLVESRPVFLDLKFHDIPAQVHGAVDAAARLGSTYTTVHASGGEQMVSAAVEGARGRRRGPGRHRVDEHRRGGAGGPGGERSGRETGPEIGRAGAESRRRRGRVLASRGRGDPAEVRGLG